MCEIWSDGDGPSVWDESPRKARKEHKCEACRGHIRVGAVYYRHFSVYDGIVTTEKCCASCQRDRKAFAREPGHLLPMPSSFTEYLDECIADDESTSAERRKWKAVLRNLERRGARATLT